MEFFYLIFSEQAAFAEDLKFREYRQRIENVAEVERWAFCNGYE